MEQEERWFALVSTTLWVTEAMGLRIHELGVGEIVPGASGPVRAARRCGGVGLSMPCLRWPPGTCNGLREHETISGEKWTIGNIVIHFSER